MSNPNYARGVRFERRIMAKWKAEGYTCIRSAGSHSPFDIICLHPNHTVVAIQAKTLKKGVKKQATAVVQKFLSNPPLPHTYMFIQMIEVYAMKDHTTTVGVV